MKTLILFCAIFFYYINDGKAQQSLPAKTSSYAVLPGNLNRKVMLQVVNEARASGYRCGNDYYKPALPLRWSSLLEEAAYDHTLDMTQRKYFSHTSPEGKRAGERIDAAGYNWKTFGENIGQGFTSERDMVQGWLSSPGHCKNIMNPSFTEMGVSRIGKTWTQTFGSR